MSRRGLARLAWSVLALSLTALALSLAFAVVNSPVLAALGQRQDALVSGAFQFVFLLFSAAGALVAARQPSNPIGWLLCVVGINGALAGVAEGYAIYGLRTDPGSLPGADLAAVVYGWQSGASFTAPIALVLLLFPTGRLPSRRWRPVVWAVAVAFVLVLVADLVPGPIDSFSAFPVTNPLGIPGGEQLASLRFVGFFTIIGSLVAGVFALARRLRRARGDERQQLKWFAFAGALFGGSLAAGPAIWFVPALEGTVVWPVLFFFAVGSIPVATAVAILRHRLYDIDVVINRALVYGALTACLALCYWLGVVALGQLLGPVTSESDLAIAGSTLAVAALFRPLRARIQAAVDHRFYRGRYDAARTLEAFSAHLRQEVALDALSGELRAVVAETMQPAQVWLWLRAPLDQHPRVEEAQR